MQHLGLLRLEVLGHRMWGRPLGLEVLEVLGLEVLGPEVLGLELLEQMGCSSCGR